MYHDLDFLLFDALRHAGRSMRSQKQRCNENAPSNKREIILAILSDNGGTMRHNQLASAFRVSPSTLSEMLNRLEDDGFLTRSEYPSDRRATLLTLSEKGRSRAAKIKEETHKAFAASFSTLSDDEKRQLITLLHKIPDPDQAE